MKMERLIGTLSILLQREKVTAPELAEQFEVSRRTIQRDIESLLIDLSSWYKTSLPPKIELIQGAIEQHRAIRFTYFSPKGESERTVEPCCLVFHWSTWYVWGWCRMREEFRMFKLNRMTDLTAGEYDGPHRRRAL